MNKVMIDYIMTGQRLISWHLRSSQEMSLSYGHDHTAGGSSRMQRDGLPCPPKAKYWGWPLHDKFHLLFLDRLTEAVREVGLTGHFWEGLFSLFHIETMMWGLSWKAISTLWQYKILSHCKMNKLPILLRLGKTHPPAYSAYANPASCPFLYLSSCYCI